VIEPDMVLESYITKVPLVATVKVPPMLPLRQLSLPPKMQLVRFASESIWNAAVPLKGPVMPHGGQAFKSHTPGPLNVLVGPNKKLPESSDTTAPAPMLMALLLVMPFSESVPLCTLMNPVLMNVNPRSIMDTAVPPDFSNVPALLKGTTPPP